jgi:hypothetical protein
VLTFSVHALFAQPPEEKASGPFVAIIAILKVQAIEADQFP